jgi:hypothetical protein
VCACQWELPQELAEAICLRTGGTTLIVDPKNVQTGKSKVVAGENADCDGNSATINYLILETVQDESCQMKNKQNGDGLYTWPELPPNTSGSGKLLDSAAALLNENALFKFLHPHDITAATVKKAIHQNLAYHRKRTSQANKATGAGNDDSDDSDGAASQCSLHLGWAAFAEQVRRAAGYRVRTSPLGHPTCSSLPAPVACLAWLVRFLWYARFC